MSRYDDDRNPPIDLSPDLQAALRWLPEDGSERRCFDRQLGVALRKLRHRGLCGYRAGTPLAGARWWLTAEGRALRARLDPLGGGSLSGEASDLS